MRLSHGFATGVLVSALSGCFPEERLNPPRDGSADVSASDIVAPTDVPQTDAGGLDAEARDVVTAADVVDASLRDVPAAPTDVDLCAMVPAGRVPAMPVFNVESGARDLAFDGRGNVALTAGNRINLAARGGTATPLVMDAMAEVTALRFTRNGQLVFATSALTDAGTVQGALWVLEPGGSTPAAMRWSPTGRVDGLAINPDGTAWYSDRTANTVFRFAVGDPAMPEAVVRGVAAPRALAFDGTGRVLYVGGSAGVFRVNLDGGDGGVGTPTPVFTGTDTITGLAVDTCGNLWVANERPGLMSQLMRWDGTQLSVIYESADGVRALAFGQGGDYDDRVIYFLQPGAGAMRAVGVVARGVPRPSAAP